MWAQRALTAAARNCRAAVGAGDAKVPLHHIKAARNGIGVVRCVDSSCACTTDQSGPVCPTSVEPK